MRRHLQIANIPNPTHINRKDPQHMAAADIRKITQMRCQIANTGFSYDKTA